MNCSFSITYSYSEYWQSPCMYSISLLRVYFSRYMEHIPYHIGIIQYLEIIQNYFNTLNMKKL